MGQQNKREISRSFYLNLLLAVAMAGFFTVICVLFPRQIMGLYTTDEATKVAAGNYLFIIAGTFLAIAVATMLSTMFRCMEKATLPLVASIIAAALNTILNYILIFGKFGFKEMGAEGAAIATVVSQLANFFIMLLLFIRYRGTLSAGT